MIKDTDKGFKALRDELDEFKGMKIQVGVLGKKASTPVGDTTVGAVAGFMEFGTSSIPARPFVRQMADSKRQEIGRITEIEMRALGRGDGRRRARASAKRIGALQARLLRTTIREASQWAAPLDESTIRAKGSSRPLIDTGTLVNSVSFRVEKNGQKVAEG